MRPAALALIRVWMTGGKQGGRSRPAGSMWAACMGAAFPDVPVALFACSRMSNERARLRMHPNRADFCSTDSATLAWLVVLALFAVRQGLAPFVTFLRAITTQP